MKCTPLVGVFVVILISGCHKSSVRPHSAAGPDGSSGESEVSGAGGIDTGNTGGSSGNGGSSDAVGDGGTSGSGGFSGAAGASGKATAGSGGSAGTTGSGGSRSGYCLDGIADYANNGPFSFEAKTSGSVNIRVPNVSTGCKVPIVHLANGTGSTCAFYQPALNLLASHGFLTLCFENLSAGAGDQGIKAFETALSEYPNLADYKFGSTGHDAGGQAALLVLQLAEEKWGDAGIYAGLAIEPVIGFGRGPTDGGTLPEVYARIKAPVFMFSGLGTDTLVSQGWVQQTYDAMSKTIEAYFWAKEGANHITTVNQDTNEVSISWFRWKLLGDEKACEYFKAIPTTNTKWTVVASQNEKHCQ